MPLPGQSSDYGGKLVSILGPNGTTTEVGEDSSSLQTTPYDSGGSPLAKQPDASFIAPIDIRQTTNTSAGEPVWILVVSNSAAGIKAHVRKVHLEMSFDGEIAEATTVRYQFCRCSGGRPTDGSDVTPILCDPGSGDAALYIAQFLDTGLTDTNVTYETAAAVIGLPLCATESGLTGSNFEVSPPIATLDLDFGERQDPNGGFIIRAQDQGAGEFEGIAILIGGVDGGDTVEGISLKGYVIFDERQY